MQYKNNVNEQHQATYTKQDYKIDEITITNNYYRPISKKVA